MFLKALHLVNFKNYSEATVELTEGINIFTGSNGSGKTNILDAVYYLAMCKSYFASGDLQNIKHGEQFAIISGDFYINNDLQQIFCSLRKDQKKIFKKNNEEYEKLADHIGLIPVVMIAPQDHELVTEGSDQRRKFIDTILSQTDHHYLDNLIRYNRFLSQRNALLKQHSRNGVNDYSLFEFYDAQLNELGTKIHDSRKVFIKDYEPLFIKHFNHITSHGETPELIYVSQLNNSDLRTLLSDNFRKDLQLEFTSAGIHKDDIAFSINNFPVRKYASQGQQKSYTTALKLAQFEYISNQKKTKPIILLDDIYDKLDDHRVDQLMQMINEHLFGQVLITDTNELRIKSIFDKLGVPTNCYKVNKGAIS